MGGHFFRRLDDQDREAYWCTRVGFIVQDGEKMVGLGGFEPPTSPLSGVRSNQLSYRPEVLVNVSNLCWVLVTKRHCTVS